MPIVDSSSTGHMDVHFANQSHYGLKSETMLFASREGNVPRISSIPSLTSSGLRQTADQHTMAHRTSSASHRRLHWPRPNPNFRCTDTARRLEMLSDYLLELAVMGDIQWPLLIKGVESANLIRARTSKRQNVLHLCMDDHSTPPLPTLILPSPYQCKALIVSQLDQRYQLIHRDRNGADCSSLRFEERRQSSSSLSHTRYSSEPIDSLRRGETC